jgi:hypothetical protein
VIFLSLQVSNTANYTNYETNQTKQTNQTTQDQGSTGKAGHKHGGHHRAHNGDSVQFSDKAIQMSKDAQTATSATAETTSL